MPEVQTLPEGAKVPVVKASKSRIALEAFTYICIFVNIVGYAAQQVLPGVVAMYPDAKKIILSLTAIIALAAGVTKLQSLFHLKNVSFNTDKDNNNG